MTAWTSISLFLTTVLLFVGSCSASSTTAALPLDILDTQTNTINNGAPSLEEQRKLSVYALYNLDKFNVRFLTAKTAELERARSSAANYQKGRTGIGDQWIMVSETGGLQSSLSYPFRTLTQEFLYIGFQNLVDDWILELSGGPDGDNDLSYRNITNDNGNRFLQIDEGPEGQVYNIDGGDSTGEEDYNDIGNSLQSDTSGMEIDVEPVDTIPDASVSQEESESPQVESTPVSTTTNIELLPEEDSVTSSQQNGPEEEPETTPIRTPEEIDSLPTQVANGSLNQPASTYVNIYEGLVFHSMYEHLVTVDLRVKLYLRKDGLSSDLDSVRRHLRNLEETGEAELLAEVTPTIAFLEPVSEAKRLNKPSNSDVRELFGRWMEYMFGKQRSVYLRTLREYQDQPLLQEISTLRVDVSVLPSSPSVSAATSSNSGATGAWSEKTQRALVSALIVLGVVAVIWPMYTYVQHIKKHREISLQLMNVDGGDDYDFSDSFGSVTYKDNIEDMIKLPPINPSVPAPSSFSLPRPQSISLRASSLDAARHGKDIFPSKERDLSQKSALSALEKSDQYLSRHRPDLFYDQQPPESKGTMNMFGRSYEIPSNPFELIYKGWDQISPLSQPSNGLSPPSDGSDLGRNAHFPFASPRSSFTPRSASVGSNPYTGRSTSVGSVGSAGNASHFKPINVSNQNLAAGICDEDEMNGISSAPGIAAHTGHTWQNNDMAFSQKMSEEGTGGSMIGNIFRNLSISSWYNGNNINNSYTANSHMEADFYPTPSSGTEEVYYDDYHHQHQDPSLFQREIELESLPNDEESPANYDFAFQDFPRKDGTPCLIIDDDSFLSERKRRESAKVIFNINDEEGNKDDGSLSEKKLDDIPVSDEAFKMMLSQNALDIDNSVIQLDGSDDMMILPPLESSFLNKDPHDAKSPEFQSKLSRLMETKQQRYTRENKNAAIVAANRKKRKNVRERERVDRHKAIERELEDIEAEFSLTMQPLSPNRNKNTTNNNHGQLTPKRNTHSPKPGARYSPMPSRVTASPARKNIATLSPPRSNVSTIAANSPARSSMGRSRGIGRNNSLGGSHKRQNSLGASPFRTYKPRPRQSGHAQSNSMGGNSDIFRKVVTTGSEGLTRSASQRSASPPGSLTLDGAAIEFKPKFRPTNSYSSDRFSGPKGVGGAGNYDDLSLPSMTIDVDKEPTSLDAKFRSPQAVIDEVMQSGAQAAMQKPRHYHQPARHSQRSLTPTRHSRRSLTPSKMRPTATRRTNSFDVSDDNYQRRAPPSGPSMVRQSPSMKSNGNGSHRRARSGSIGSNHRRTSSRDDDIFLHGVVAQTRFI